MHKCIHTHMYTKKYLHICICIYIYAFNRHVRVYLEYVCIVIFWYFDILRQSTSKRIWTHICMFACIYVHLYIYTQIYVCVYTCICIFRCIQITIKRAPQNVEPIILVPQAASAVVSFSRIIYICMCIYMHVCLHKCARGCIGCGDYFENDIYIYT